MAFHSPMDICCGFDQRAVTSHQVGNKSHQTKLQGSQILLSFPRLIWEFTESDAPTFILPNTVFGLCTALADPTARRELQEAPCSTFLLRLGTLVLFNWANTLLFDLANQYTPAAVREDLINKPWRPIPSGRVTAGQVRAALPPTAALVLALDCALGVGREGAIITLLTWVYNVAGGSDGLLRNPLIALGYALYNTASLRLATAPGADARALPPWGGHWIVFISAVITTTMHIQDLKDQEGDALRGRRTIPLVIGHVPARLSLAIAVCLWSLIGAGLWRLHPAFLLIFLFLAAYLAVTVYVCRTKEADARSWRLWSLWMVLLYQIPLMTKSG